MRRPCSFLGTTHIGDTCRFLKGGDSKGPTNDPILSLFEFSPQQFLGVEQLTVNCLTTLLDGDPNNPIQNHF